MVNKDRKERLASKKATVDKLAEENKILSRMATPQKDGN